MRNLRVSGRLMPHAAVGTEKSLAMCYQRFEPETLKQKMQKPCVVAAIPSRVYAVTDHAWIGPQEMM